MATPAAQYVEHFQLAAAAFAEGRDAMTEAGVLDSEAATPLVAHANQTVASGLIQIKALARKYMAAERLNPNASRVIISDATFRAAAEKCADGLDEAGPLLPVIARRIASALRKWIEESDPDVARRIVVIADAAARMAKMRSARTSV